jgi:hypothetical protein
MTAEQAFEMLGNQVAEIVLIAVRNELEAQGHKMDGNLSKSIQYEVKAEATKVLIEYSFLEYGMALNYGVKPSKIPYRQGSGAKESKFIDGLKYFVLKKMGKVGKEAEGIAFAIAKKMKTEGMPTKGSYKYSTNGRRLNWIGEGLKEANPKVIAAINKIVPEVIDSTLLYAFTEISKSNSKNLKVEIK